MNIPHDVNQIIIRICFFQREIKLTFAITQYSHFPGIINKVLSWKGWIVLSRLTFAVYLLHYIIIQSFIVQLRHPFFYKPDYEIVSVITVDLISN